CWRETGSSVSISGLFFIFSFVRLTGKISFFQSGVNSACGAISESYAANLQNYYGDSVDGIY
ncbi:MAG: hypothetical protein M3R50_10615, partial [Bacteroidota bacterium]|nr:hypothetical protein [Bacteroidota bacterium]